MQAQAQMLRGQLEQLQCHLDWHALSASFVCGVQLNSTHCFVALSCNVLQSYLGSDVDPSAFHSMDARGQNTGRREEQQKLQERLEILESQSRLIPSDLIWTSAFQTVFLAVLL